MADSGTSQPDFLHPLATPFRRDGTNGEAFVLVHGFTGNPAHFRPLAADLTARGSTVNVPLLPGHGRGVAELATATRNDWIDATLDAIREVGDHPRVHLVGLSMGGLLGVVAATRWPQLASLTTINAPVVFQDRRIRLARLLRHIKPELVASEAPVPDLDADVVDYWIHSAGFPLIAAAELFALSRQALAAADRVAASTLVIQSRTDTTTHPRSGPKLKQALGPSARLLWLERSMHNAVFDRERHVIAEAVVGMAESVVKG